MFIFAEDATEFKTYTCVIGIVCDKSYEKHDLSNYNSDDDNDDEMNITFKICIPSDTVKINCSSVKVTKLFDAKQ